LGSIFGAHASMIEEPSLFAKIEELVEKQGYAAEYAVSWFMRHHAKALENIAALAA